MPRGAITTGRLGIIIATGRHQRPLRHVKACWGLAADVPSQIVRRHGPPGPLRCGSAIRVMVGIWIETAMGWDANSG